VARRCGAAALFRTTDVADPDQIAALVESAVERFGGLDIMCNNAGISGTMHRSILHDDFADFHRVMSVNVLGVMAGTRLAARYMSEHGGGSIINLSSVGGVQAGGGVMTYRASKAAVIHFTKSAAIELAQYDIRVNCLAPGNIPTDLLAKASTTMSPEKAERMTRAMREMMNQDRPLPREGTPEDVAEAAVYFAGDRSRYLTGTVLTVDGGTTAGKPLRARRPDPAASGSASAPAGSS
jgi:NAD(P)-dependent dehydrogenase (short-subunit alcohol dehydrogenase family)